MVRAILAGTKSQTRRVVRDYSPMSGGDVPTWRLLHDGRWYPIIDDGTPHATPRGGGARCPYGAPGDRLWVREAFAYSIKDGDGLEEGAPFLPETHDAVYRATDADHGEWEHYEYDPQGRRTSTRIAPPWRPSIFMPRWASRLTLEVTGVRVERLHAITEDDARAEGIERYNDDGVTYYGPLNRGHACARVAFERLWHEINGAESWDSNPFVWCVSFRRLEAQERAA